MPLSQQQKYTLGQLGIPIWVERSRQNHDDEAILKHDASLPIDSIDIKQLADVIVVCESRVDDLSQKRLLAAILKSVSLTIEQVSQLQLIEFEKLTQQTSIQQRVLVFCDDWSPKSVAEVSMLRFPSLTTILAKPTVKAQIWQQLKLQS